MTTLKQLASSPGLAAIALLAVLTGVEYIISVADVPVILLWLIIIAVVKAAVIVVSFMHLMNLFGRES